MTDSQRGNSAPHHRSTAADGSRPGEGSDERAGGVVRPLAPVPSVAARLPVSEDPIPEADRPPRPPAQGPVRDTTRVVLGVLALAGDALGGSKHDDVDAGEAGGDEVADAEAPPTLGDIALGAAVETHELARAAARTSVEVATTLGRVTGMGALARVATRAVVATLEPLGQVGRSEKAASRAHARAVVGDVVDRLDLDPVLDVIDINGIIDRVDIDRVVGRVDIDKVVGRVDIDGIVSGIDIGGIIGRVDINGIVSNVDIGGIIDQVDIGGIVGKVDINTIVSGIDIGGIVGRVDINGIVNQVDVNSIVAHVDVSGIVAGIDLDAIVSGIDIGGLIGQVDINGIVSNVDLGGIIDQVDIGEIVAKVDVNGIVDTIDINEIVDKVDIEGIIGKVDIDGIMQRTELGGIIAHSTSSVAGQALDVVRSQGVGLDQWTNKWVNRVMRRKPGTYPLGPPEPDVPAVTAPAHELPTADAGPDDDPAGSASDPGGAT